MVVCIMQRGGACWYTTVHKELDQAESVALIKGMIDRGESIKVWWFVPYGQRYSEEIWLDPTEIAFIRTESDDG